MIVVDSSAWVELLRRTRSPIHQLLRRLLEEDAELAVTEIVVMELLQGARSDAHVSDLRSRLLEFPVLPLHGLADYQAAAALFRTCRRAGETVRRATDCLIAVPAIRAGAAILHLDTDFEKLARHSPLEVVSPSD